MAPASSTFLFDPQRTGRSPFAIGTAEPRLAWSCELPSYPPRGPESSPAFDEAGNLYFGSHDGCFYSLDQSGRVRWMFKTDAKIYSSPDVQGDQVRFCSGDGRLYCFSLDGHRNWIYDLMGPLRKRGIKNRVLAELKELPITLDWRRKYMVTTKSWCSPVTDADGRTYATGYGKGLHCVTPAGERAWAFELAGPKYTLSGPCLGPDGTVYASAYWGKGYAVAPDGQARWGIDLPAKHANWGTPSCDPETGDVYFVVSKKEETAQVAAVRADGSVRWRATIPGGLRGGVAISRDDWAIVAGLAGELQWLRKDTGQVIRRVRLSPDTRGLWTTPVIDPNGNVLVTTKQSNDSGSLVAVTAGGERIWEIPMGKALSSPVVDASGLVYAGSWDGTMRAYATT